MLFLAGAVLLVVGMGLFTLGADMAMMPMGEALGRKLARSKRVSLMAAVFFLVGVLVTVAEPDLTVLATQVPGIPDPVLIWTVAAGESGCFWWCPWCGRCGRCPSGGCCWCCIPV